MILTESRIRQAAADAKKLRLDESYRRNSMKFDSSQTYDLFISHSFKDRDIVLGLSHLFTTAGYKIYIDWIDDSNLDRKNVTSETAKIIKNRIRRSTGLSYVSTSNSITSKWCPWELGVGDGMHGKVCILPIMNIPFNGQEYLGLYPYLEYSQVSGQNRYEFWVYDQKEHNKYRVLKEWLKGYDLLNH